MPELIPFRWPKEWKDSSKLELLKNTPINCLVGEAPPPFPLGDLKFVKLEKESPPEGFALREGVWPQVLAATKKDAADAGAGLRGDLARVPVPRAADVDQSGGKIQVLPSHCH